VAVDGLGDGGGLVADRVADLLDRYAVAAHDRDRGVAAFVGVPLASAGLPGHLAEAPSWSCGSIPVIRSTTYLARKIFKPHMRVHTYLSCTACTELHFYCSNKPAKPEPGPSLPLHRRTSTGPP
jgi:hypothetical protein